MYGRGYVDNLHKRVYELGIPQKIQKDNQEWSNNNLRTVNFTKEEVVIMNKFLTDNRDKNLLAVVWGNDNEQITMEIKLIFDRDKGVAGMHMVRLMDEGN